MDTKFLDKLEFNIIINKLASFCETDIGKGFAFSLLPSFSFDEVNKKLEETNEAYLFLHSIEKEPNFFTFPIDLYRKKLESMQNLNLKELLNVAYMLKNARRIKKYLF